MNRDILVYKSMHNNTCNVHITSMHNKPFVSLDIPQQPGENLAQNCYNKSDSLVRYSRVGREKVILLYSVI